VTAFFPRFRQSSKTAAGSLMAIRPSRELYRHYISFLKGEYYLAHAPKAGWDDQGFWNIAYGNYPPFQESTFGRLRNAAVPNAKFPMAQRIGLKLYKSRDGKIADYLGTIGVHYNGRMKPWIKGCGGNKQANLGLVKSWRYHLKEFLKFNHTTYCRKRIGRHVNAFGVRT